MSFEIETFLCKFTRNGQVSLTDIQMIEQAVNCPLPEEYRAVMRASNGGEGFMGKQYLVLWKAEDILRRNKECEVEEYAPGLLLFGSNGAGEGFAFDLRDKKMPIVVVPFIGMSLKDTITLSQTFFGFLERLFKSDGNLFS
jgi:hypothetical protein